MDWTTIRRTGRQVMIASALTLAALACSNGAEVRAPEIAVYKSPSCGCCSKWAEHLREAGFAVTTHEVADLTAIKRRHGIGPEIDSCHTAIVDGYAIEGHVPADTILRLLKERPKIAGLAVPGMPMGSPGMEGSYAEPYDILAFDAEGHVEVYDRR